MSQAPGKKQLSDKLDFEGVDGQFNPPDDFFQMLIDQEAPADPSPPAIPPERLRKLGGASAASQPEPSSKTSQAPSSKSAKSKASLKKKKDNDSTKYVAGFSLLGFVIAVLLVLWYLRSPSEYHSGLSYATLPEVVISRDDQVMRMQASVQVATRDEDWLQENKKTVSGALQKIFADVDLESVRTPEGKAELQKNLAPQMNEALGTNKIQAVLLTELLMQNR